MSELNREIVKTNYGMIKGIVKDGYTEFLGIPYAKPPVGELRWKAPERMDKWEGVLETNHFPNRCMQMEQNDFYFKEFYEDSKYETDMSEDCLYLNIWMPNMEREGMCPVAFFIHGGAFFNGYGHEKEFDGEAFCKQGVILVTCNYRLGALGFLAHPWLMEENPDGLTGNYGIRDQIAALTWVYENISAFGGDSNNITVFGQSAGSMSTQVLVSSELTQGMISKAIFQSAGGIETGINIDIPMDKALKIGIEFAQICNVKSLEELRNLPMEEIRHAALKQLSLLSLLQLPYVPIVDNDVLYDSCDNLARKGKVKKIPYMLGSTKNDLLITDDMLKSGEHGSIYKGCIKWSQLMEKVSGFPSYVYYFARDMKGDDAGAFHSAELWYVFGTLDRCWRPKDEHDYELSRNMVAAWTNFCKTGNPNPQGEDKWRTCTNADPFVQVLE